MESLCRHFSRSLIDWVFRRRSLGLLVLRFGLGCIVLAGAGWALDVSIPFRGGQVDISFNSAGGTPTWLAYAVGILGSVLTVFGLVLCKAEQKRFSRKKVVVVETRGLRDIGGTSLIEAIPASLEGYRDHILIDMRQRIKDGEIVEPEAALDDLISLPSDLRRREDGFDRSDLTFVYGGLAPVPFTFLTGVLIDDECEISIFDWDRHREAWRELDGLDDGNRFKCSGLDNIPNNTGNVALTVSVSYGVNKDDVRAKVGEIPIVALALEGGSPDCHWSKDKQCVLGKQFLETVIGLGNRGVRRIHLFLAAQNSVVFRFGRLYDKRNLPEVVVYQYQRSVTPPYPWGVLMPVCGIDRPTILGPLAQITSCSVQGEPSVNPPGPLVC